MKATAEQIAKLGEGGRTTYERSAWDAVLDRVSESGDSEISLELDFPSVKPAHVRHMLRLRAKERNLTSVVIPPIHKELGVSVKFVEA